MLAVVAYAPSGYDFATTSDPLPYYAAVIGLGENRVIASYRGGVLEDGAIQVREYTLNWDTARYDLANGIRGFALRVNGFRMSGGMDGGLGDDLTLFVIDGNRLKPVIEQLSMHEWTCTTACVIEGATRVDTKVVISVANTKSKGFYDLVLIAERSNSSEGVRYRAKFDGSKYLLDGWLETWNKLRAR